MDCKIGVVGAGLMGAEIALAFALAGCDVVLNDRDEASLIAAMERLQLLLMKGVDRGFYSIGDVEPALKSIRPEVNIAALAGCDLVTEAVFEDLAVKTTVLQSIDAACKQECIIATNTSTIPISTLAATLSVPRREQFIGTHYFSPVSRMKLVEVISGFSTNDDVVTNVMQLMIRIGKVPVRVRDVAGFAVNRMLHAFMIEAVRLVDEGVASPEDIDIACRLGLGHPLGPFELMDRVTSNLCVQAQEIMYEAYGERFRPPALLKQRVRGGFGGGRGNPGWLSPSRDV